MFTTKYLNKEEIFQLLLNIKEGYKEPSDELFDKCNKISKPFKKLGVLTLLDENELHAKHPVVCNIFGCNQIFQTVFEFESHYNSLHRYLCSSCKKNLPSAHLLDLHVSEAHDSFFAAQAERKPMYSCYVPECPHKSINPKERKDHCIREHKFPTNFRFETSVVSNVHREKPKEKPGNASTMEMECEDNVKGLKKEEDKNNINNNFFSFGHQRVKVFSSSKKDNKFKKEKKKSNNDDDDDMQNSPLEDENMITDLLENLPEDKKEEKD